MKTTTLPSRNLMNLSPLRGFLLILFVLAYFALSPQARAVCQEGCNLAGANTWLGDDALLNNTTGVGNTAIGARALWLNTTGFYNTAIGGDALQGNTTGSGNTAIGRLALYSNTTGGNTAIGSYALFANTTGNDNTATGGGTLYANTTGIENTANGGTALRNNQTGNDNTATGFNALFSNTTGANNTAHGANALYRNATGNNNIALGVSAGFNLTTGNNNIYIGNAGNNGEHNKIRIGMQEIQKATFIAGISGVTVPAGVGVIVGTDGKLGTVVSTQRFKDEIKPMNNASEAILALKPVTFRYKHELDPEGVPQFGLVAEEVEKVNPDLVARDEQGKPYTVRYEAVNAMLLNEFLKEHAKVQQLKKDFESKIAEQQRQIEAFTAGLQKVSAELELSKAKEQTVLNDQ